MGTIAWVSPAGAAARVGVGSAVLPGAAPREGDAVTVRLGAGVLDVVGLACRPGRMVTPAGGRTGGAPAAVTWHAVRNRQNRISSQSGFPRVERLKQDSKSIGEMV